MSIQDIFEFGYRDLDIREFKRHINLYKEVIKETYKTSTLLPLIDDESRISDKDFRSIIERHPEFQWCGELGVVRTTLEHDKNDEDAQ